MIPPASVRSLDRSDLPARLPTVSRDAIPPSIRDLELVVGKVPTKDWEKAQSLARELHTWRRARVRAAAATGAHSGASRPGSATVGGSFQVQYFDIMVLSNS